jgi:hypothetical protein
MRNAGFDLNQAKMSSTRSDNCMSGIVSQHKSTSGQSAATTSSAFPIPSPPGFAATRSVGSSDLKDSSIPSESRGGGGGGTVGDIDYSGLTIDFPVLAPTVDAEIMWNDLKNKGILYSIRNNILNTRGEPLKELLDACENMSNTKKIEGFTSFHSERKTYKMEELICKMTGGNRNFPLMNESDMYLLDDLLFNLFINHDEMAFVTEMQYTLMRQKIEVGAFQGRVVLQKKNLARIRLTR